ncbi:MAG: M48 family metalloprotease [Alphaproteobacteria bacterium]|nr:M48 family metalloprotease [Alphaproteobacteria bacterium]
MIRDEEIEKAIHEFLVPLFKAANLDTSNIGINLVKDDSINAFATSGLNIFINTGLLMKASSGQEVIAVLAHETGHISGGHILRLYDNIQIAQRNTLISVVAGVLAGLASGSPDVATGMLMGGIYSAQGVLAGYRRAEESAADQTAVSLLKKTGHDLSGFAGIMKKLKTQEDLYRDDNFALWQTHPMVKERLELILQQSFPAQDTNRIARENKLFDRIRAKLIGFLADVKTIDRLYKNDDSINGKYAKVLKYYRIMQHDKAQNLIDELIKLEPKNPYFYELKGQMLFETGNGVKAISPYRKAVELNPKSELLRVGLAQALLSDDNEETNKALTKEAIDVLTPLMNELPMIWHLKAVAYGRLGNIAYANYALMEYNISLNNKKLALDFAKKIQKELPETHPYYVRASDVLSIVSENQKF